MKLNIQEHTISPSKQVNTNIYPMKLIEKEESSKTKVKYLYIEADEDHVSLQNGLSVMPRLVYIHEGYENTNGRNRLKNIRYFSGIYNNIEEL